MKIFVCIKQVPDTETKIKLTSSGIDTSGIKWIMNPYDEFAVEEAIKTRDANPGSQLWAITLGPKSRAQEVLRTALAMGADEGILINTNENPDSFTTAKALASAINSEGGGRFIFTGKVAIDDNASSVSQMLAGFLEIPHVTAVSKLQIEGDTIIAHRDVEGGAKEIVQITGPAVIAANKGLNMPRYASLPGIMKAKKKTLKEIELSSLGLDPSNQKIVYSNWCPPPEKPFVKMLSGDTSAQVSALVSLLRDEAKVL
ncbi:MAG: electron transfer flavoprotein subunit beta/FixA family protein [Bdellovibrionaceae bacterium]|nr:electron transfer flavoprotein subunit beta/FixA family protein [Pseudobdellovibrionaceae bacterium]